MSVMRVLALVPHPTLGPSSRLRVGQYVPYLAEQGIDMQISSFIDDATYRYLYEPGHTVPKALAVARGVMRRAADAVGASRYDLVLIHRESLPFGPPVVERSLVARRVPYVFDFDDAIYIPSTHPANRRFAWLRRLDVASVVAGARRVIAGNEHLALWACRYSADVSVLPTPVDTDRHRPAPRRGASGPVVIGWVGSSSTAEYLDLLDEPLRRVAERRPILVRVMGGRYRHATVPVHVLPYSLAAEPAVVAGFDIGVLPQPDNEWTRGKGGFKALVYMAAGVPVVASRVGVNPEVVRDGVTGYCVKGIEEWTATLERLVDDADLRRRLGGAGREFVDGRYSLRVMAPRFAALLRSARG